MVLVTAYRFASPIFLFLFRLGVLSKDFEMAARQLSLMSLHCLPFYAIIAFSGHEQARAKRVNGAHSGSRRSAWPNRTKIFAKPRSLCAAPSVWPLWGQLTAGLAHELRNPLGTIKASAEMLTKPSIKDPVPK